MQSRSADPPYNNYKDRLKFDAAKLPKFVRSTNAVDYAPSLWYNARRPVRKPGPDFAAHIGGY